ncbi:MAG: cupin domain-containing protein [Steroidobacteraceae bacterium]
MDLLSDILRDLRLESAVFSIAELRAPWGFNKGATRGAPFCVIVEGRCWLQLEGCNPIELVAGDLVVVPHGAPYALMSGVTARRVPFGRILAANGIDAAWSPRKSMNGLQRIRFGGRGDCTRILTGMFVFPDPRRSPVLAALPPLIHVPGRTQESVVWLSGALRMLIDEAASAEPGYQMIVERLADIIFVQAVREWLRNAPTGDTSWLRGLADGQIARALALIHSRPAEQWTVAALARAAALSRTGFADRFRTLTGASVMEYVTKHRMHRAQQLLARGTAPLAEVCRQVGYRSEISFSRAFSRWIGMPPGEYRRRALGGDAQRGTDS